MFNSDMLEVATGLVFIYLLFSFVATAARESLEAWIKTRGALLEKGLLQLLRQPGDSCTSSAEQRSGAAKALDLGRAGEVPLSKAATEFHTAVKEGTPAAEALISNLYSTAPIFSLFRGDYAPPSKRKGTYGGRTVVEKHLATAEYSCFESGGYWS